MAHGYRWLALEYDDFANHNHWPFFRDAMNERGILPGVWFTHGGNMIHTPHDARFTIGEDEGPADRQGIVQSIPFLPPIPRAIITNAWVIKRPDGTTDTEATRATTKPIVDDGFAAITEVYARTDNGQPTGLTPEKLHFTTVRDLGFAETDVQPCFGIFGGATSAYYDQWRPNWRGWSDYVVENTLR